MNKKLLRTLSIAALGLVLVACGDTTSSSSAPASSSSEAAEKTLSIDTANLKSKKELGDDYGMAAWGEGQSMTGGTPLEWYVQTNNFETYSVGKTVETLTTANYVNKYNPTGTETVEGCTISQANFVDALKNTTHTLDFTSTAAVTPGVAIVCDGFEDGVLSFTVAGSVVDAEGKVVKTSINAYQIPVIVDETATLGYKFDTTVKQANPENFAGHAPEGYSTQVLSKRELGSLYGMTVAAGETGADGKAAEWDAQANAFGTYAEGKEASSLVLTGEDSYKTFYVPNGTVAVEGCTITMDSFAAAVAETATLKSTTTSVAEAGSYKLAFGSTVQLDEQNGCVALSVASYVLDGENKVAAVCYDTVQAKFTLA